MNIIINDREVAFNPGETVLQVANRAGIRIPHLCSLDWAPSPSASCRLCVVEVEGSPRLQTSCTLQAAEGMKIQTHTPRVMKARRSIVELMVANHPQDCLACERQGACELADLTREVGVRPRQYVGMKKDQHLDISSPAISRDPNKCILCGRCVTMCHQIQGIGAIDFTDRGFRTQVGPGFSAGLNVSGCTYCGQCVRVCPTGALMEHSHVNAVVAALSDPNAVVVAQIAPAVPATLDQERPKHEGVPVMLEHLAAALKRIGFDAVFDTGFAADLTVMEEATELVERVKSGGVLPMFTSCSPAWIQYVELHRPDLIPHLSTCKSPQQMAGALIREIYPKFAGLDESKRLVVVSLMPCTAKKFEAQDLGDVDYRPHHPRAGGAVGPVRGGLRGLRRPGPARSPVRRSHGRGPPLRGHRRRDGGGRPHRGHPPGRRGPHRPAHRSPRPRRVQVLQCGCERHHPQPGSHQRPRPAALDAADGPGRHALRGGHVLPGRLLGRRRPTLRQRHART